MFTGIFTFLDERCAEVQLKSFARSQDNKRKKSNDFLKKRTNHTQFVLIIPRNKGETSCNPFPS